MKLSLEIPYAHLEDLSPFTDFDFALAQLVLNEAPRSGYIEFYRKQSDKGREVWLDNGFHELKRSLPLEALLEAAARIGATHIVAPEVRNDPIQTRHLILSCVEYLQKHQLPYKVVGAWQGYKKDLQELLQICDVVALPFARPRASVVDRYTSRLYHYFGFRNLDELRRLAPKSLDTSIPIRAAYYGLDLELLRRRPKTPLMDFHLKLTKNQLKQCINNIHLLKEAGE